MRTWQWVLTGIGIVAVAAFLTGASSIRSYTIPTGSMEDTLRVGDHILTTLNTSVERGDIIAYRNPDDPTQTFLKRVVGVPGDRIRIVRKDLLLNGIQVEEPYVKHPLTYIDTFRDNFPSKPQLGLDKAAAEMLSSHVLYGHIVVPSGAYFVLGDNRDSSLDSRFQGFVSFEKVIGKLWLIWHRERGGFVLQKINGYQLAR